MDVQENPYSQWVNQKLERLGARIHTRVRSWEQKPLERRKKEVLLVTALAVNLLIGKFMYDWHQQPQQVPIMAGSSYKNTVFNRPRVHLPTKQADSVARKLYLMELNRLKANKPKS